MFWTKTLSYIYNSKRQPKNLKQLGGHFLQQFIPSSKFDYTETKACVKKCGKSTYSGYLKLINIFMNVQMTGLICLFVWCLTTHQPLWVISVRFNMVPIFKVITNNASLRDEKEQYVINVFGLMCLREYR